jgi:hypothetical protein
VELGGGAEAERGSRASAQYYRPKLSIAVRGTAKRGVHALLELLPAHRAQLVVDASSRHPCRLRLLTRDHASLHAQYFLYCE